MADEVVRYEVDEKVGIITLNRPDKLNAISHDLQHALTEAFARADADAATSVVLLRAEGRSFCAGYDIGAKEPGADDWRNDPIKAQAHLAATRIRDGAVADAQAGDRVGARPCPRRRLRARAGGTPTTCIRLCAFR